MRASCCSTFSCCGAWALGCTGFSSCGFWALEHRFSSCGAGLSCSVAHGILPNRDWTHVCCIGRWILYHWATREALFWYFLRADIFHNFFTLDCLEVRFRCGLWDEGTTWGSTTLTWVLWWCLEPSSQLTVLLSSLLLSLFRNLRYVVTGQRKYSWSSSPNKIFMKLVCPRLCFHLFILDYTSSCIVVV